MEIHGTDDRRRSAPHADDDLSSGVETAGGFPAVRYDRGVESVAPAAESDRDFVSLRPSTVLKSENSNLEIVSRAEHT